MFQTNLLETIKTYIGVSIPFFFENSAMEKYCREEQATDNHMAHVRCMLDNYNYRYTLRIRNAYCFSTANVVA
jgi:hypothetical protein